jgi:hypothetical protein
VPNAPKLAFAFSAIVLWTKQRTWVGGDAIDRPPWFNETDHAARDVREALRAASIFVPPWSLSNTRPRLSRVRERNPIDVAEERINADFEGITAEQFVKWLRDALAHGDARKIRPIHRPSRTGNDTFLAGFEIVSPAERRSKRNLTLSLYHADMTRIGAILADGFCKALSGGDRYFEQDAATATINLLSPFKKCVFKTCCADRRQTPSFTPPPASRWATERLRSWRWSERVATYRPFLWRPEEHMFLKPEVTKDFAVRVEHRFAKTVVAECSPD